MYTINKKKKRRKEDKKKGVNKEQIANRLKELRGSKSQTEVAQAVGVTPMAISLYESGERIPRDEIKVKIAEYFGTTVDAIFFAQ